MITQLVKRIDVVENNKYHSKMSYSSDNDSEFPCDTYAMLERIYENTASDREIIEMQNQILQKRNNRIRELESSIDERSWVCNSMFFLSIAVAVLAYFEGTALGMYISLNNHR